MTLRHADTGDAETAADAERLGEAIDGLPAWRMMDNETVACLTLTTAG